MIIGDGVTSIGDYAFENCTSLTSITIPDSVTSIGEYAFYNCTELNHVLYKGTEEAWNEITKYNSYLPAAIRHYNCTGNEIVNGVCTICNPSDSCADGHTYESVVTAPTCVAGGYTTYTCSVCGDSYVDEETAPTGEHNYVDGICSVCGAAEATASKGLEYTLSDDGTYYIVSGIGTCTDSEVIIPAVYEGLPVTAIGESAFTGNYTMTTIAIPASLTTIGDYAFDSCDSLTTVIYCGSGYMEAAVNIGRYNDPLFMALRNLQHHQFQDGQCVLCGSKYLAQGICGENLTWTLTPDGLLTISGTGAMEWGLYDHPWQAYSDILRTVVIEEGATTIYTSAFRGTDITSVTIPSGIISIGDYAFDSCYELKSFNIPDGVQSIGVSAFSGCLDATGHLVIPDSVTSLGDAAFSSCMSLTGLTIGSGITVIGRNTFGGCSGITEVTIPDGVTTIGEYAFQVCGFTQVVIPASVTSIAGNAFSNCENLTAFVVDEENTAFSTDAQGILYNKDKTVLVTAPCKISSCVIPDTVITVGDYAFGYCPNLTELTLGNNVVTIGAYAFWLCGMTEIHIPDSVTTIGDQAFAACDNMTVAILGNGVTTVGNFAFGNAPLTLLRLPGSIATIGSEAFRDTLTTVIYCGTAEQWTQIENYTREYIFSNTLQFHDLQNGACIYCSAADEVETEGTCGDNLTWSFADGVLTISGTGDMWDYEWINDQTNSTPWSKLVITEVRIEQGVTSIGKYAFEGCADLTSVTIAPSVSNIGNYAFSECTGLTAITIPEGVTTISQFAFAYCTGLTQLVIPDSVTSVAEQAFRECSGLTDLTIGTGITKIANYMFAFCDNLTCVSIPDGVTEIEYNAFQGCEALTQVRFPASIKTIGYESFKNCSSLTTVIYCGTPSQWEEVSIMTYNNGFLLNAAMQYHDFQDGVCSYCGASCVDHVWNDATCTAPKTCVVCGATEGEALEHNYVDGVCSLCGVEIIYGDANGDGEVDGKDLLLLRRYMANYNFTTGESTIDAEAGADANGDGTVNGKDLLLMRRYMANYNFSTGESTIVLGPEKSGEDLSGTYDVTLWVSENDGAVELILQQIAAFEAANPGIVINASIESVADYNAANNIVADVASAPDIYCITQERLALLVQIGALSPLDANAAAAVKTANSTDSVAAASVAGNLYAYPMTSDNGYFMYYDTSIISEEDAESMEAIIAACEKAGLKFRFALDNAWYSTSFFFGTGCHSNWTWDAEGNLIGADDTFNSAAGLAAMKGMQMLAQSTCHDSNADIFTDAAVVITGVWNAYAAANHFGENLGATDLPSFTVDGQTYHLGSFAGNKLMGVKPQTDAQKQAVLHLLAQYLTNEECQMARYDQFGWIPSNMNAQASEDVQSNISVAAMIKQHKFSQPQRQIPNFWWDAAKMLGVEVENATTDVDLQTALDNYSDAINDVLGMTDEEKEAWSVIGGICGTCWDTDIPMTKIDDVTWESEPLELKAGEQFKVRRGGSWELSFGVEFQGENVVVEADGTYIVRFVWYGGQDGIVTLIPVEEEEAWSVIGNICGTCWDTDIPMTKIDDVTWESEPLELHTYEEFKVRRGGSWDLNFGAEFQGANVVVEADGTYIVRLVWYGGEDGTVTLIPVVIAKYTEAPYITDLGIYGNVEDRLPVEDDIFVSLTDATGAALEIGTYGGTINLTSNGGSWDISRPTLETIIRRNSDGTYYPNVIKSYEYNDDYTVWTFHLREGMKWSDGDDFNADDITFWYYMCHINNYDSKASWVALKDAETGNFAKLEKVDDLTVTWTFENPKFPADFIENGDFKWCWAPSHWLKDLIPSSYYVENPYWENTNLSDEDVLKNARAKGVDKSTIKALGKELTYYFWNVGGMPTVNSFVLRAGESRNDTVCHLDRNPYYWKVDAQGQQLPYCDGIVMTKTSADGQDQLMFRSGEVDMIGVAMQDIASILADMGDKAVLRTFTSVDWGEVKVTFNYTHTDPNYANLFNNIKFRQAVSIAVDRQALSELLTDGFLLPGQCAPQAGNFGYDEEWINKWTEYDVATAKKLLEECGLVMGDDGFYNFADGSDLEIVFYSYLESGAANEYPILEQYFTVVGLKTAWKEFEVAQFDMEIDNNTWTAVLDPHTSIGGLSMKYRVAPFVPVAQAAEWYGEFGTWYQYNGEKGVEPTGDMAKLIELYEQWNATPNSDEKDALNLEVYEIHKKNLWTIAYLQSAGIYDLVSSAVHNYPDNLVSSDLYMYANIVHYENLYKVQ